jgi:hypothetical protein
MDEIWKVAANMFNKYRGQWRRDGPPALGLTGANNPPPLKDCNATKCYAGPRINPLKRPKQW